MQDDSMRHGGGTEHTAFSFWPSGRKKDEVIESVKAIPADSRSSLINPEAVASREEEGANSMTDSELMERYFRKYQLGKDEKIFAVATTTFLGKSADSYPRPFVGRELVQNFIDHNREFPGTLNGVEFNTTRIKPSVALPRGGMRFEIMGRWPFGDSTGITKPHSEKPEGETAGGNGIGLKQVATLCKGRYGVSKFLIEGDGWDAEYVLAKADEINRDMEERSTAQKACSVGKLKHDWLGVKLAAAPHRDFCRYVIETGDEELIKVLMEMKELGVSKDNPFLQNADFENEHGIIKWLPEEGDRKNCGRFFVNGQVMRVHHYKDNVETGEDYWKGMEGVTLSLNQVRYKMSIDRPPMHDHDVLRLVREKLIPSMTAEELLGQLAKSELLWGKANKTLDEVSLTYTPGWLKLVEAIIKKLTLSYRFSQTGENKSSVEDFRSKFSDRNYLCADVSLTADQFENLQKQGYVVCSGVFKDIGMPKASEKLSSTDVAFTQRPNTFSVGTARNEAAEKSGVEVSYEDVMEHAETSEQFFKLLRERIEQASSLTWERLGDNHNGTGLVVKLAIDNCNIDKKFLSRPLFQIGKEKPEEQKLLLFLRGIIFAGLRKGYLLQAGLSQGDCVSNFALLEDYELGAQSLVAKVVKSPGGEGVFLRLEVQPQAFVQMENVFSQKSQTAGVGEVSFKAGNNALVVEPGTTEEIEEEWGDLPNVIVVVDQAGNSKHLVLKKLEQVPVDHPEATFEGGEVKVMKKTVDPMEEARIVRLDKDVAGLESALEKLEDNVVAAGTKVQEIKDTDPIAKYLNWRNSSNFYGQAGVESQYLSGRHVLDILEDTAGLIVGITNESDLETRKKTQAVENLSGRLKRIAQALNPEYHLENDFEIILNPTEKQLARISLLRHYFYLMNQDRQISLPNDIFLYKGSGSFGINIGQKAIGLHESLLDGQMSYALSVLFHEVAHNASMEHDPKFMNVMQGLWTRDRQAMTSVASKMKVGVPLGTEEALLCDVEEVWDGITSKTSQ